MPGMTSAVGILREAKNDKAYKNLGKRCGGRPLAVRCSELRLCSQFRQQLADELEAVGQVAAYF